MGIFLQKRHLPLGAEKRLRRPMEQIRQRDRRRIIAKIDNQQQAGVNGKLRPFSPFLGVGIVRHISNEEITRKSCIYIISQLAIITVSADPPIKRFGAPNVVTNGVSVTTSQTDTGIGSNPHLRAQSTPTQPSGNVTLSERDKSFMQKATGGGQQEVKNGKMAEKQGQSGDVKRVGARIVADHTEANKELTQLASQKGFSFDTRGVKAQNPGNAGFDRQYLKLLEADQKNDIAEFQKEAKSGDDRDVKSWASKTLPMLKEHLATVQDAEKRIK